MGKYLESLGHGRHFLVLGTDAVVLILAFLDLFDFFFGGFTSHENSNQALVIGRGLFVFVALLLYSALRISQSKRKGNFALYIVCLLYILFHAIFPDSYGMNLRQLNLTVIIFSWTGFRASLQLFLCFIFVTVSLIASNNKYIAIENSVVFLLYFGFGILSWQLQLYIAEEFCWCRKDISLALRNLPDQFFASDERIALSLFAPIMARKELAHDEAYAIFMRTVQWPHAREQILGIINEDPGMDTTSATENPLKLGRRTLAGQESIKKRQTLFIEQQQTYRRRTSSAFRRLHQNELTLNGVRLNSVEPRILLQGRLSNKQSWKRKDVRTVWLHSIDSFGNKLYNPSSKGGGGSSKVLRQQKTTAAANGPGLSVTNINLHRVRRRSATAHSIAPMKISRDSRISSGAHDGTSADVDWCTPKTCVARTTFSPRSSGGSCNLTSNLDHKPKRDADDGLECPPTPPEDRSSRRIRFTNSALPASSSSEDMTPTPSVTETPTNRTRRSMTSRGTMALSLSTVGPIRRRSEVFVKLDAEPDAWRRPSLLACVRRSDSIHKYMLATKVKLDYPYAGAADRVYLSPYRGIISTQASLGKCRKTRHKRRKAEYEYKRRGRRRKRKPTTTTIRWQDSTRSDDDTSSSPPTSKSPSTWRDIALNDDDYHKFDNDDRLSVHRAMGAKASGITASTAQSSDDRYVPKPKRKSVAGEGYTARRDRKRPSLRSVRSRRRRSSVRRQRSSVAQFTTRSRAATHNAHRNDWLSRSASSSSTDCSSLSTLSSSHLSTSTSTSFGSRDTNKPPCKVRRSPKAAAQKYIAKPTMSNEGIHDTTILSWIGRGLKLLKLRLAILESVIQEGSTDLRAHMPRGNVFGTFSDRKIERWYLAWSSVVRARIFCSLWSTLVVVVSLMTPLTLTVIHIVSYLRIEDPQLSVAKFSLYVSFRCIVHCALLFAVTFPQRRSRFRGSINAHHFLIRGTITALLINIFSPSDYIVATACGDSEFNSVKYVYLPLGGISLVSLASPTTYSVLFWSIALTASIVFVIVTDGLAISFLSNVIQFYILHYFFITRPYSEVLRRIFCRFVLPYILLVDCILPLKTDGLLDTFHSSSSYDGGSITDADDSSAYTYNSAYNTTNRSRHWRSSYSSSLSSSR